MGDLHGRYDLLKAAMNRAGFNKKTDRLFSVGDIIDRGKQSGKCLRLLEKPWFYMVRGNHEQMMIDAFSGVDRYQWLSQYGRWTRKLSEKDCLRIARRLDALPLSLTIKGKGYKFGISHAEPANRHWPANHDDPNVRQRLMWGRRIIRNRPKSRVKGVAFTVHGHTPLKQPVWVGNRYFMDTGAWYSGQLTFRLADDLHEEITLNQTSFS